MYSKLVQNANIYEMSIRFEKSELDKSIVVNLSKYANRKDISPKLDAFT
jgi:hypothetical protein